MTVANPKYADLRWNADENRWEAVKQVIGADRLTLGPQASHQLLNDPAHYCMVLARYRAAAALIGTAASVLELGCGEGIGAGLLARGRSWYYGVDSDADAVAVARSTHRALSTSFQVGDILRLDGVTAGSYAAVVSLDVIEHLPTECEGDFMRACTDQLAEYGACVVGSPSANAAHLASPQSQVGHVNLYTPDRLRGLLSKYFHLVQMWGMQDVALHSGHEGMWHYIMGVGIGPRR